MIGKEANGLYILKGYSCNRDVSLAARISNNTLSSNSSLNVRVWHKRFVHVSITVLKKLLPVNLTTIIETINKCQICPCAKQIRLPFPLSTSTSLHKFELLHMDLWGPYKTPSHNGNKYFLTIIDDFTRMT